MGLLTMLPLRSIRHHTFGAKAVAGTDSREIGVLGYFAAGCACLGAAIADQLPAAATMVPPANQAEVSVTHPAAWRCVIRLPRPRYIAWVLCHFSQGYARRTIRGCSNHGAKFVLIKKNEVALPCPRPSALPGPVGAGRAWGGAGTHYFAALPIVRDPLLGCARCF